MSAKERIGRDYENFAKRIDLIAQQEIEKIQEKVNLIKKEAEKTGADVEVALGEPEEKAAKKKVNT